MRKDFELFRKDSSRVTYAAVFVPYESNPDQSIKYLLPEGIRGAAGFETYNADEHHRENDKGMLCCGNCYEQGKNVPVFHRGKTDERVGGGDKEGTKATWSAYPNTIDDHTDECKERRTASGRAEQTQQIRWNINIPETYHGEVAPETIKPTHHLVAKRTSKVIHNSMQEMLPIAGRLSAEQVQNSVYVVSGRATPHRDMLVDGDNWKRMVTAQRQGAYTDSLFRLFHITIPTSRNIRDCFADAATGEPVMTKIACERYSFKDAKGVTHVIQPSIETNSGDVKTLFEKSGDYFVLGPSRHTPKRVGKDVIVHEISLYVTSPALVAELYKDPSCKVRDYNAFHHMQIEADEVQPIMPKRHAGYTRKGSAVHPDQQSLLFDTPSEAPLTNRAPH